MAWKRDSSHHQSNSKTGTQSGSFLSTKEKNLLSIKTHNFTQFKLSEQITNTKNIKIWKNLRTSSQLHVTFSVVMS